MQWFLNLTTRTKLFFGFGTVLLFLAVIIGTSFRGITAIQQSQRQLFEEEFADAVDLKDIRANQNAIRAAVMAMAMLTKRSDQNALDEEIKSRRREVDDRLRQLLERNRNDEELLSDLRQFNSIRNEYQEAHETQIIPLIYEGKVEEAKRLLFVVQAERNQKLRTIADKLVAETEKRVEAAVNLSDQEARESIRISGLVGLFTLGLGLLMVLTLSRAIANPLKEISAIAERVASRDLTVAGSINNRRDEVGVLAETFRRMVSNLRQVTGDIKEGVNVLGSSASEILAATTQVAAGAAETATSVSETTTTVEEVKQTSQLASQKAKYVSESGQKSAQVSQSGKKAIEQTIAGMNRIREQMEAIAESIVRLSEQSQAIGEIIATVNDLAEQSNLLAVNAAIEAAKAGEQGKGFAVVAQEVKSLAEQSKQATAQVRTILGDIQKATSAAVMATEQGGKAVEAGVKQSLEGGESIRVLADSIAEAAQAATQIAASAQQQLVGMDQVALAMENIKQASAQNVASTKQAEVAAQNLHQLGEKLKLLVEQYKL